MDNLGVGSRVSSWVKASQAFLLDTNVLIHNPKAIESFGKSGRCNVVVLTLDVLEELDRKKKDIGAIGVAARAAIRELEKYRLLGDLSEGVLLTGEVEKSELFLVVVGGSVAPPGLVDCVDNRLLGLCLSLKNGAGSLKNLTLVTKDINLRVKANVLGIYAEDYLTDKVDVGELYAGQRVVEVESEVINELYYSRELKVKPRGLGVALKPNELVCLVSASGNDGAAESSVQSALAVVKKVNELEESGDFLRLIPDRSKLMLGKGARNREQQMALDLLLDPAVPLVTINGTLGTGKTFITLLGALHAVLDRKDYDQILIARKYVHHGVKEGFLPGDLDAKAEPWMKPFYACLDLILGGNKKDESKTGAKHSGRELPIKPHEYLVNTGVVRCEHLAYIRGVTYTNKFIIIDEAANLTPDEAKTIIGRAGEGTKVVFLGDIDQIDDPYLDASSNGLAYTIDCWKDEPEAGHITLEKCERSVLAKKASKIM